MIGLHLLSRPNSDDPRLKRQAQADATCDLALKLKEQGCSVIVLGDFNDYDGQQGSTDHIDSTPINQ